MNGVSRGNWPTRPSRRRVECETRLPVSPGRALEAFLDPADLLAWWGVERALIEPTPGGVWALAWGVGPSSFAYVATGIIECLDPARRLVIGHYTYFNPARPILGPMRLVVSVGPTGVDGTCLTLVQDGYQSGPDWDWYHEAVTGAWPMALEQLARHLSHSRHQP